MSPFIDRVIRAARLDAQLYEEVEADGAATGQAAVVVLVASVAAGIGLGGFGIGDVLLVAIGALIGWVIWAALTYFIGTRLLPEPETQADVGQLMRTIGFASAPGVIRILAIVPGFTWFVFAVSGLWMLAAMVIAVRQALDYRSTGRAVAVCAIGFIVQIVLFAIFTSLLGVPAAST
jgi:hypothetical protein